MKEFVKAGDELLLINGTVHWPVSSLLQECRRKPGRCVSLTYANRLLSSASSENTVAAGAKF